MINMNSEIHEEDWNIIPYIEITFLPRSFYFYIIIYWGVWGCYNENTLVSNIGILNCHNFLWNISEQRQQYFLGNHTENEGRLE